MISVNLHTWKTGRISKQNPGCGVLFLAFQRLCFLFSGCIKMILQQHFYAKYFLIWLLIERRNNWPSDMNLCIISGINIQLFALPAWDVHWHRCDPNDRQKCRRFRLEVTSVFLSVPPFFVSLSLTREDYLQCSIRNKFCSLEGIKNCI